MFLLVFCVSQNEGKLKCVCFSLVCRRFLQFVTYIHSEAFDDYVCMCVFCKQNSESHNLLLQRLLVDWVEMLEPFVFSFIEARTHVHTHTHSLNSLHELVKQSIAPHSFICVLTVHCTGAALKHSNSSRVGPVWLCTAVKITKSHFFRQFSYHKNVIKI